MSETDRIIRQIYYDVDTGFGSIAETTKNAKRILNTITYNDVKDFLDRQKSYQIKGVKGFNSYVAHDPLQEIQVDIADFTASSALNNGFRYLFVAIDIFTKFCHAVPIKDKQPTESVRAMKEVLSVIGKPKVLYHDFEGSWNSKDFIRLLNQNDIKQIITSSPPPFAERMVQTIKNMIFTRLEGLEIDKQEWINLLPSILKKYNNTIHSTIGFTPNVAKQGNNNVEIWVAINSKATYSRKYPPLKKDDVVRTYIKKKSFSKGYDPSFSRETYKVIGISDDGKRFMLDNNTRRMYSRHELRKVNAVESKEG